MTHNELNYVLDLKNEITSLKDEIYKLKLESPSFIGGLLEKLIEQELYIESLEEEQDNLNNVLADIFEGSEPAYIIREQEIKELSFQIEGKTLKGILTNQIKN